MLKTTNYQMNKPELTDSPPDITVLNGNFDIMDEKLFSIIKAWEDFKSTGGKINGDLELLPIKKLKSRMSNGREVNIAYMQNNGAVTYGDELNPTFLVGAERPSVWENGASNSIVCVKDYINSKGSSGYTKLPNGIVIEWGVVENATSGVNTSITFPIEFPNTIFTMSASISGTTVSTQLGCNCGVYTKGTGYVGQNTGATRRVFWIALGY
ncbi:MAG: hypothetical protein HUJ77_14490 [Clostridium sp.]|uniref:gp53-like domain-containing protein n=1 Tax=Clostridium sp. TaxID=1506 RepID=UPI0025BB50E3|nr:hypothetical protein [Clostridium sp.]MCF0149590.1 hypothetical protein [Clostridium sp.]